MTETDKVHEINEQFKDKFANTLPGLFDRLWQILVDGVFASKVVAFTPVLPQIRTDHFWSMGIATANERGYTPTHLFFISDDRKEAEEVCAELNKAVFEIEEKEAFQIVLSSMNIGTKNPLITKEGGKYE